MNGFPISVQAPVPRPTWYAAKNPLEALTWSETITPYVLPTEIILTASAQIAPSGSGEMQATSLTVSGQTLFLGLSGGQPTRIYTVQFVVQMTDGGVYQPIAQIACLPVLPTDRAPPPPDPGFGPAIIWSSADWFSTALYFVFF